jgi:hypothetical protein
MRKIEQQMIAAIKNGKAMNGVNTTVSWDCQSHTCTVRLFGNTIATIEPNADGNYELHLTDANWKTATTKSRLNALLSMVGGRISQTANVWHYWDGKKSQFFRRGVVIPFDWDMLY